MLGSDLTVPLFFIGLGVAVFLTGISQAGWKHPLLIKGLFVVGGLLGFSGLFWSDVKQQIPLVASNAIESISHDPESWFVASILALMAWMLPRHPSHKKILPSQSKKTDGEKLSGPSADFLAGKAHVEAVYAREEIAKKEEMRKFTNRLPTELTAMFNSQTGLKAEVLLKPYIGLWIEIKGRVYLIERTSNKISVAVTYTEPDSALQANCWFSLHQESTLMRLEKNDLVIIRGKISSVHSILSLVDCEIDL